MEEGHAERRAALEEVHEEHSKLPTETVDAMLLVMGITAQVFWEMAEQEVEYAERHAAFDQVRARVLPAAQATLSEEAQRPVQKVLDYFECVLDHHISWRRGPGAPGAIVDDEYS